MIIQLYSQVAEDKCSPFLQSDLYMPLGLENGSLNFCRSELAGGMRLACPNIIRLTDSHLNSSGQGRMSWH